MINISICHGIVNRVEKMGTFYDELLFQLTVHTYVSKCFEYDGKKTYKSHGKFMSLAEVELWESEWGTCYERGFH